jgi:hypothetical protein
MQVKRIVSAVVPPLAFSLCLAWALPTWVQLLPSPKPTGSLLANPPPDVPPVSPSPLPKCSETVGCPTNVPGDFVATPAGWYHPSCRIQIANSEKYDASSNTIVGSGGASRTVPPCLYPSYAPNGEARPVASSSGGTPQASAPPGGYLESVDNAYQNSPAVSFLYAGLTVPQPPTSNGATIYLFPGLTSPGYFILQPLLAYSEDGYWYIQAYDDITGSAHQIYGSQVNVKPGDEIIGELIGSSCSIYSGACSTWEVYVYDVQSGLSSYCVATNSTVFGPARTVYGAALEVYNATDCSYLPASGVANFSLVGTEIVATGTWYPVSAMNLVPYYLTGQGPGVCSPVASISTLPNPNFSSISLNWTP